MDQFILNAGTDRKVCRFAAHSRDVVSIRTAGISFACGKGLKRLNLRAGRTRDFGGNKVTERELAKLAEYQDEDAIHYEDLDLSELLKDYGEDAKKFKDKYGEYYDDIKFKEKDWW